VHADITAEEPSEALYFLIAAPEVTPLPFVGSETFGTDDEVVDAAKVLIDQWLEGVGDVGVATDRSRPGFDAQH
jgi:hypothetical protein